MVNALLESGFEKTIRIVDVGCGVGYTTRWLAANIPAAEYRVEFVGMDLNSTLIAEALAAG